MPADGVARADSFSVPFYAIILKTTERCGVSEPGRLEWPG
jgi:hypothetical protein